MINPSYDFYYGGIIIRRKRGKRRRRIYDSYDDEDNPSTPSSAITEGTSEISPLRLDIEESPRRWLSQSNNVFIPNDDTNVLFKKSNENVNSDCQINRRLKPRQFSFVCNCKSRTSSYPYFLPCCSKPCDSRNLPPNDCRNKSNAFFNSLRGRFRIYTTVPRGGCSNASFLSFCLISLLYLSFVFTFSTAQASQQLAERKKGICSSLDIRNSVESFRLLEDCTVIEGFLQIVLMDRTNESHFANLSFPKLNEITGYLLLYRVNGLRSLSKLFPNLSVIRGHHLFINYALAIYEMLHLQEVGLHSLIDIPRGAVFITKNPLLCYIDTIDWNRIVTSGKELNLISDNRQSNACPKCPSFGNNYHCAVSNITKQSLCWNSNHCQRACPHCNSNRCSPTGECCSDYCLGGCTGPGSNKCIACKNVYLEDTNHCVVKCPDEYYKFKDRRCIKSSECYAMPKPRGETFGSQMRAYPWKPFNGTCIFECPPGFQEVKVEGTDNQYKCELCKGVCRKVCEAANVDSIQSAQRLKGCVVINGSLEIQIRGGDNIVKELEESLNLIEEITGYLKVVRSLSLVSLNFLRRLRVIGGEHLESGKYALIVLDNQNLVELWDFKRKENELKILQGRIFFHFNPKLCLDKIKELQDKLGITDVDELDVARNSNGDKVACNMTDLQVSVARITYNMCLLTWIPYTHFEMRTLLGYVIYVMEAPHMNVSMNDGRDACGGDGWKVFDVEVPETTGSTNENITQIITHLKPYTLYAYYIKTYTIATETNGAQSKINYFRTHPATPTPPRQLKITAYSSSEVFVEWQPPELPNGNLAQYLIFGELSDGQHILEQRNYCSEPVDYEKKDLPLTKDDIKKKIIPSSTSTEKKPEECVCAASEGPTRIKKNDQDVQALIEFENKLHDSIYIKNLSRTKREIPHLLSNKEIGSKDTGYKTTYLLSNEGASTTPRSMLSHANKTALVGDSSANNTTKKVFRQHVNSTQHSIMITNLQHFSQYSISVQACRDPIPYDLTPACSPDKMATVQTHPLESADKIDPKTIEVEILNSTNDGYVKLKWMEPALSNGPILTYQIKYKRMDIENQQPTLECITHFEFIRNHKTYILKNLHPGNYSLTLRATSLARETGNNFTPVVYFYIKESSSAIIHQLFLGALFALFIVILVVVVMLATLRYFYPDTWHQRRLLFASVNPEYFKPIDGYDQWEISRRKIQFENLLGIGHFGEVYEGRAKGIIQKGVTTKVAIKTLSKAPNNHRSWLSFLNEASVMKQFDTTHVVSLLGVVTKGEPLVIMELMARGDLRTYLRSCRQDVPDKDRKFPLMPPPTLKEILQMSAEIADGMLYLTDKKFVHRDLAARNCMINDVGTVKIGDFGLTRDIYETDYYRKDSKGHLPVRWMAPESLRDGIFTSRSDVWSYGVVLWEMATLASLPYTGLGNGEVMPFVINGGVMEVPENCPTLLTEMMKLCWQYKYTQRPTFSDIIEILLPHLRSNFEEISYYHSEAAVQLRASNAEAAAEDDTPYTPLRQLEDFEEFSLESDDEDNDGEHHCVMEHSTTPDIALTTTINHTAALGPITLNGYIRRPHHIHLNNTKTTTC